MSVRRVVTALAIAVPLVIAAYAALGVRSMWAELREAADMELPPGYVIVEREERGTAFCPITCPGEGEPVIDLTVAGPTGADPCADLAPAIADQHGPVSTEAPMGLEGCLYAELDEVSGDAHLVVSTSFLNAAGCPPAPAPCARLHLSSGVE